MEYSFYDFLKLLGSLALFLYGMKIMSEGLQKFAGDRLRKILTAMTTNRVTGVLTGVLITALVQSSSATTVMVVSFVNAGLLTLSQSTEPIDIQAEIESYADECDIKNIVRKASFDPEFLKSLSQGALTSEETPIIDITEFPQNIHEYHQMIATAQLNAMKLAEMQKKAETDPEEKTETKEETT